ncbi:hypothetical protein Hdeb2414_s0006g00213811 [Helianthus debilis subsp. tardiflorus]
MMSYGSHDWSYKPYDFVSDHISQFNTLFDACLRNHMTLYCMTRHWCLDNLLVVYVGFYKGVQSAGKGVAWQIDTHKVPYMNQLLVNWALTTISYPLLALVVIKYVKDEDKVAEDDELQTPSENPKQSNDESLNPI